VRSGGGGYFTDLIRGGFVDVLLAGNALAVHDVEQALFGTSLGVDLEAGVARDEGHRNHMRAINAINRAGGLQPAVEGGTLRYLSPEVLTGRPADEADEVWSLCVVLCEMVSGAHPFTGEGIDEVVNQIRNQRLSHGAPPVTGSEMSAPVAALAASMLAASRSARPTTARAFAEILGGLVGGRRSAVQR